MPNELRVRADFIGGVVTDNPLAIGATTLTSSALAAVPVIGATQHFPIVIDPDAVSGAPEVVYVTSHASSATTATILRGQEGTVARQHASNTTWVHGPLTTDFTTYGGQLGSIQASGDWTLVGSASYITNGVQLAGTATSQVGAAWHVTPIKLDGLTLQFTASIGIDGLRVLLASSASNPTALSFPSAGIETTFFTWYQGTAPDGTVGGHVRTMRIDGTAYSHHITDTRMNQQFNNTPLTSQLVNVQARQLPNRSYELITHRGTGGPVLRAVLPSPTDTVYLGFQGFTGGNFGVTSVTNLTATYIK